MNNKIKCVYSLKCAGYLMLQGYPLLEIQKNRKDTNKNVFIFNYSSSIDNTIEEYKQTQNK